VSAPDRLEALVRHETAMATVRAFGSRSGAAQVLVLIDRGDDAAPTMVEWRAGIPLELTDEGITWEVPDEIGADVAPLPLPHVHPAAPASSLRIDAEAGIVEGPMGAVAALCLAVRSLAEAFGGRSVASADWPTAEAERHFTIAARPGEPAVLGVGDQLFELPGSPA
jgi:hypothetical protein